jgi:hypothetical protein
MTKEEIEKRIKSLDLKQNAIKILINSFYGANANKYFYFYSPDIAQSITLQGQDLIKFSIKAVNHYFLEKWHLDTELHEKLGISQYKINKVNDEAAVYTDTDSCHSSTSIRSIKYGAISIEDWYNLNIENGSAGNTLVGHESVNVSNEDRILNWTEFDKLHYSKVRRIIRHKVSKECWKLVSYSNKEIIVTGDHSLIVFRDNQQIEIKAKDILIESDKLLTINDLTYSFESINSVTQLDDFKNEYVYDVEVDEDSHTFIANDILIHNSIYVQFESAMNSIEGLTLTRDDAVKMCVMIDHFRLAEYFDRCFQRYGLQFNTTNRLKFKLENISEYGIWLKKKNYALKVAYEPNNNLELFPEHKRSLLIKGLESIKGSYPLWARDKLKELTAYILEIGKNLDVEGELIPKLKDILQEAKTLHIDDLAFNFKVRVFDKYVENEAKLILKKGISIYPRAAAYYNYLLILNGLDTKYNKIKQGESIRFYHCAPNKYEFDVFSYSPKNYPEEIAPPMDLNRQFFTLIIEPINRFLSAMKITPLDENLRRQVEVVKVKTKKEITDDQMYPLYVLDKESLEYTEVSEKFWKIIGNPEVFVSDEDYPEYLETITRYGLNSLIIPKYELDKYIKRIVKKRETKLEAAE